MTARIACLLLAAKALLAGQPPIEEHDITAVPRPMAWGDWSDDSAVACGRLEDRELYRAPSGPGHTCWTSIWRVPASRDIMMSFVQMTGPLEVPPLDATGRQAFYERFGRENGQWFIDHSYVAQGRKIEMLTMRSEDLGRTWRLVGSEPYPGVIGVLDDPDTIMLPSGNLVRVRAGMLYQAPGIPFDSGLAERSEDGGKTWSRPTAMLDRTRYYSSALRVYLLRDGRLAALVIYYRKVSPDEVARRNAWTSTGLVLSEDEGRTWTPDPIPLRPNVGGFHPGDEAALAELPNGNLFGVFRVDGFLIRASEDETYQSNRQQALAWRDGKTFRVGAQEDTPIPHGARPDVIYLKQDLLLYTGIGGFWWTADLGRRWQHLALPADAPRLGLYQPECVQLADDSIYCAYHVGGDDAYGRAHQSIRGVQLSLTRTTRVLQTSAAPGENVAIYGHPEDTDTALEASLRVPGAGSGIGLLVRATPGAAGRPNTIQGYMLKITSSGLALLRRERGAKETVLGTYDLRNAGSDMLRIGLSATGGELVATLNGTAVLKASDNMLPHGGVGLYTSGCAAEFRNPRMKAGLF